MDYQYYGMTPFGHQLRTIKFLLTNKRAYDFSQMGAGKTASALWAADMLLFHRKIKRVLIICPLSIIWTVWANEIRKIAPNRKYAIMHGPRTERLKALHSDAQIVITNHDCVRTYKDEILKEDFDLIIVDELTAYKHNSSARSKAMQKIAYKTRAIWGLTGSPITTGPMDSYGIAKVINPVNLPTPYFSKYRNSLMYQIDMYNYEAKPGWENTVFKTLQPAIKHNLEDCIDIPPITFETRQVRLTKEQEKMYREMVKEQVAEYHAGIITAANAAAKFSKLLQISCGTVKNESGEIIHLDLSHRLAETELMIIESGRKLIIFCQFIGSVIRLTEYLKDKGYKAECVYGDVNVNRRTIIFDQFQNGDLEVLIAQVKTASHGVTLTASNHILYFGPIMGAEAFIQSIARIRRTSQTRNQNIIKFQSTKAEERLYKKLDDNEVSGQAILDMYDGLL